MGLILWIDQNTFATGLIERAFKKKNIPFYSVPSVNDFAYLVEDLNPEVIVLDGETFSKNPAAFKKQYESSLKMQSLPFIFLAPTKEMSFIKTKRGELKRPLDPFQLSEEIPRILALS